MLRREIFVSAALVLMMATVSGQESIFGLHAVLGINASQITGDELAGYDKIGIHGGLRGTAELSEKASMSVELLYSVRGSRPDIFNDAIDPDINITLRYLDLPVYLTYSDWYDAEKGYYKAYVAGGFSFGRLIEASTFDHYNTGEADLDLLAKEFSNTDFAWLFGFGFRLSSHFMISLRYTSSITLLLNAEKKGINANSLRPYFVTFRTEYLF